MEFLFACLRRNCKVGGEGGARERDREREGKQHVRVRLTWLRLELNPKIKANCKKTHDKSLITIEINYRLTVH